jgi:hypothetical protein
MKKSTMTPKKLRIILILVMVIMVGVSVGGFTVVQGKLSEYATTITQLNANAQSGDESIQTLEQVKTKLKQEQANIELTRSFVADSSTYSERVISDLTRIANTAGVTITSFNFSSSTSPQPTTSPGTTSPAAPITTSGITQKSVALTIKNPIKYTKFMTFLELIETNPLKMQLSDVSMAKETDDNITASGFSVQVYTR